MKFFGSSGVSPVSLGKTHRLLSRLGKARRTSRTVSFMGFWHGQERRHVPACARRTLTSEGVQARQLTTPSVAALRSRSAFTLNLISSPPPLCPSKSLSTGTSTGAPLSLIKNARNFAGLVLLAF